MKTKSIKLFYAVTPTAIIPPAEKELERKDEWLRQIQGSVPAEWQSVKVKVTYEMFNPEIENMNRFFNGAVVTYWVIQNMEILDREPTTKELEQGREEILDEMLGYDYQTTNKVVRKRGSMSDIKDVQTFNTLLNNIQETIFDSSGYEFPNSEAFWEMVKKIGYTPARLAAIKGLQNRIAKRNGV